jgi:hypothetical protein
MDFDFDFDRLNRCVERIQQRFPADRCEGRSFAYMYLVLGEVEVSNNSSLLYVAPTSSAAYNARGMFERLIVGTLGAPAIEMSGKHDMIVNGNRIMFVSIHKFVDDRVLRGFKLDRVFYDVPKEFSFHYLDRLEYAFRMVHNKGADIL